MSNDSTKKMLVVALGVCLVCSVLVSTAAVSLSARQEKNKELDKIKNILVAGELMQKDVNVQKVFADNIESAMINLETGEFIPESKYNDKVNPETFNIKNMADDATYGKKIPADADLARINKMPKVMGIYMVKNGGVVDRYILPIYGKGLWSTMYGFLAIGNDLETIKGITFYEHGETPGLGGEIENPLWQAIWKGKLAYKDNGQVGITVIKGNVDPSSPNAKYQVDGLSGATLTTRGVDAMVKFWLGDTGYGPFIQHCKTQKEGINEQG